MSKRKDGAVWLATIRCIWIARNGIVFNNEVFDEEEIIYKIKLFLWLGLQIDSNRLNCSFYEWCKHPCDFL